MERDSKLGVYEPARELGREDGVRGRGGAVEDSRRKLDGGGTRLERRPAEIDADDGVLSW